MRLFYRPSQSLHLWHGKYQAGLIFTMPRQADLGWSLGAANAKSRVGSCGNQDAAGFRGPLGPGHRPSFLMGAEGRTAW